jgi:hypothetical protein
MPAKKTASKTTTKKTTKAAAKKVESDLEAVAQEVLAGKHGTGRERDISLRTAGHDPLAVQREVAKLRNQP